jgi:flagellar basal-body rod protein FlgF
VQNTGRVLDVALQGEGWIAVQGPDGREAYTRAGDLRIDPDGMLLNGASHLVLGDGGPIAVPEHATSTSPSTARVGRAARQRTGDHRDGRAHQAGQAAHADIVKSADGLFRQRDGSDAPVDAGVQLTTGVLESSNVNVADAMVR